MEFPLKCRVHVTQLDLSSASDIGVPFYYHEFFCILHPMGLTIVDRTFSEFFDVCGNPANVCRDPFRGDLRKLRTEIACRGRGALVTLKQRRKHCVPWRDPMCIYHAFRCAIRGHVLSICINPSVKDVLLCELSKSLTECGVPMTPGADSTFTCNHEQPTCKEGRT